MRFLLFDRLAVLEKGSRVEGWRRFAPDEPYLPDHFPRQPLVPGVILLEAMAQVLGWGIIHAHEFSRLAIMTLVEGVTLASPRLRPGFEARIVGEILSTSPTDSLGRAFVEVAGERVAAVERVIFTHVAAGRPAELEALFRVSGGVR